MIGFFRKLLKDRRGNALVIAGAALPLIVGAAGLANDTIQWTLWKRQLQRAADLAALAGAYDRVNASGGTTTAAAAVTHDLSINLHTKMALLSDPVVRFDANCPVTEQWQCGRSRVRHGAGPATPAVQLTVHEDGADHRRQRDCGCDPDRRQPLLLRSRKPGL